MKLMHKEVLPTWEDGRFKGKVRWKESIGYVVPFECNNIRGEVEILDYANRKLLLKYKDNKQWVTEVSFNKCHIEYLLGLKHKGFKCKKGEVIDVKTGNKIKILEVFYRERESKGKIKKDKYVEYKCLTCGNIDISREDWVLKGESNICNVCCNPPKKAMKGYNDISTTHSHLVKYFKNIDDAYTHTYNSERPVVFKCPKCGNEQDIILSNVTGRFRKGYECNQ